ncbi:MAG: peroxiredoxin-like family protein [Candidatus Hodarchaeales archaeon]|jgi:peroxiredoxin
MKLRDGNSAIDFEVEDIDGNRLILNKYYDRPILLSFYRYASCPLCNIRLNEFIQRYSDYKDAGLVVIAFFQSPRESIRKYVTSKHKVPFPIIADPSHKIYTKYGVTSSRWGYIKGLFRIHRFIKAFRKSYWIGKMENTYTLIPADFLIRDSNIVRAYYGTHIGDHIPFEEIDEFLEVSQGDSNKREEEFILT